MPTLTPDWDGYVGAGTSNWGTLMTAGSGKTFNHTHEAAPGAIRVQANSNSTTYFKFDVFLEFSPLETTVTTATLYIYLANVTSGMEIRGVKGTFTNNTSNNFNDFEIDEDYFTATTITNGWNAITLNSDAILALSGASAFKIFLVEEFVHTSAGNSNDPPDANYSKSATFYFSEHTSFSPYIDYTTPTPSSGTIKLNSGLIQLTSGKIIL
tara:strand:+ start:3703 stop:4335 length:633 start_codon:yes stop_codon:yes gene_type:complete